MVLPMPQEGWHVGAGRKHPERKPAFSYPLGTQALKAWHDFYSALFKVLP
jgi:hypothetical protein